MKKIVWFESLDYPAALALAKEEGARIYIDVEDGGYLVEWEIPELENK